MTRNKPKSENLSLQSAKELQRQLENALESQVQVTLFGSQARGEATDEADIDGLVVLPDLGKPLWISFLKLPGKSVLKQEKCFQ